MAKITTYANATPVCEDKLLWTVVTDGTTKNFLISAIKELIHTDTSKWDMYNTASISTTIVDADTRYTLESVNLTWANLMDFTFTNWVFTYSDWDDKKFLFVGSANVETDKACELTFWLFVDDVVVVWGTTPVDIVSQNKKANISINRIMTLSNTETVKVKVKSDTAATWLTVASITTAMWS